MREEKRSMKKQKAEKIERLRRRRVTFRFEAGPESDVCLAGSFNNWNPYTHRLSRQNGNRKYTTTLLLPVGRHEYKFIVDGEWQCDPACADLAPNEHGTLNSVIEVR
jgi:5'-AMP-activated protein kinase regulatory beta subunit